MIDFSFDGWLPKGRRFTAKAIGRVLRPFLRRDFNQQLLEMARQLQPDLLLAFKGIFVNPETLRTLRKLGIALYLYYPDNSVFAQSGVTPAAVSEYDCCFFTKKFTAADVTKRLSLRDSVYLPHGYDADLHVPQELSQVDRQIYGADVAVLSVHTAGKERFLSELLRLRPELPLKIWGAGWKERCTSANLLPVITGFPLHGQPYVKALCAARINLGLLIEQTAGASSGDLTTTRSYEIPACRGFMLHPRNEEILELYEEGSEIECYGSAQEALQKIDYYLNHPDKRDQIAANGFKRAVPAYSYDERVRSIIAYHERRIENSAGNSRPAMIANA